MAPALKTFELFPGELCGPLCKREANLEGSRIVRLTKEALRSFAPVERFVLE
jgi:hypothetical protein